MSTNSYENVTLVGNWYEDRHDTTKHLNPPLNRTGQMSETPIKMTRPVDDPFRSVSHSTYTAPQRYVAPPSPTMVTFETLRHTANITQADHEAAGLPKHGPERDLRILSTTTHSAHGGKHADRPEMRVVPEAQPTVPAGKTTQEVMANKSGVRSGRATGEKLKLETPDAKEHSFIQRAWQYDREPHKHYLAEQAAPPAENVPGTSLKGLGESALLSPSKRSFAKRNDALRDDTGVWSG